MMDSCGNDNLMLVQNSGYIKTPLLFDSEGLTPNQTVAVGVLGEYFFLP